MDTLFAVAAVVLAGTPLAFAVTRLWIVAVVLAPLVTGLQCAVAATAMIVSGGPFHWWLVAATIVGWVLATVLTRRPRAALPALDVVDIAVMYAPLLLAALLTRRLPVSWDARSIWWFHASWFEQGGAATRAAMHATRRWPLSHPDYPPLAPATTAGACAPGVPRPLSRRNDVSRYSPRPRYTCGHTSSPP